MEKYFSNKDYRMLYYDSFFKTFANSIYAVFTPVILYKAGVSITMIIFIIGKKSMNLLQIIKKKKLM